MRKPLAVLLLLIFGAAISVLLMGWRSLRGVAPADDDDDLHWHCTRHNELALGVCFRSERDCAKFWLADRDFGVCSSQPAAACFSKRDIKDAVDTECAPSMTTCETLAATSRTDHEVTDVTACEAINLVDVGTRDHYAMIVGGVVGFIGIAWGAMALGARPCRRAGV